MQNRLEATLGMFSKNQQLMSTLTGRENLLLQAKLNHIPKNEIGARIDEVLELIELVDKQDQAVVTYSGGMRKRTGYCRWFAASSKSIVS